MTVDCPRCGARYALPEALLGPAGARVRCPRCSGRFDVTTTSPETVAPGDSPLGGAALEAALEVLAGRGGAALAAAHARGQLFAEHGPALCSAFEAYAAAGGEAAEFRAAFARRFGIQLRAGS